MTITDAAGRRLCPSNAKVIWLRRLRSPSKPEGDSSDQVNATFIEAENRGAVASIINLAKPAKWISKPGATFRASDKLYQLHVANICGFRVPKTLVSQSKQEVLEFADMFKRPVIVKPLVGIHQTFLLTRYLEHPAEIDEQAFAACPAIYQEYIPGTQHLRLNCFGDRSYAALLQSEELDWRPNLNIPISVFEVTEKLHRAVRKILDTLDLDMGIIDIKVTPNGEYVWLEVNPQGQFLFLDALTNLNIAEKFVDYLVSSAEAS